MPRIPLFLLAPMTLLAACGPEADLDLDGVADLADNCPEAANPEQLDDDADGAGDACDLTVRFLDPGQATAEAGAWTAAAFAAAEIVNLSDRPQPYAVWTDSPELAPEHDEGVVQPGQIRTIYLNADARDLEPGAWLDATVEVETDEGTSAAETGAETVPPPPPAVCTYGIKRDTITVLVGEGGFNPALELGVNTTVTDSAGNPYSASWTGSLNGVYATNASLYTGSVATGTAVAHAWSVDAVEYDAIPAFDWAGGASGISFVCSGAGSLSDSITLSFASGGTIRVDLRAQW